MVIVISCRILWATQWSTWAPWMMHRLCINVHVTHLNKAFSADELWNSLLFFNKGDIFAYDFLPNINNKEPASSGSVSCDDIAMSHTFVQLCIPSSVPQSRAFTVGFQWVARYPIPRCWSWITWLLCVARILWIASGRVLWLLRLCTSCPLAPRDIQPLAIPSASCC